jgi:hypothetical protein
MWGSVNPPDVIPLEEQAVSREDVAHVSQHDISHHNFRRADFLSRAIADDRDLPMHDSTIW